MIAPALALAGGTVLALRLLPAGGKAGDRLAARGRRLTAALASWQISRQPIRQGGAALLIVLAMATVTLALAQRQSWTDSDHDQAAFNSGADVRVQASQPLSAAQAGALVRVRGVRHAMPVASFTEPSANSETIAVDSAQAASVSLLRADQSPLPEAACSPRSFRPGRRRGHAAWPAGEVRLTARLGPASLRLAPATVSVAVQDADGDVYEVDAGTLPADGHDHTLTADLARTPAGSAAAGRPGHLSAAAVPSAWSYTMPATQPALRPSFTRGQRVRGTRGRPDGPARRWRLGRRGLVRRAGGRPPADPGHQRTSGLPAVSRQARPARRRWR